MGMLNRPLFQVSRALFMLTCYHYHLICVILFPCNFYASIICNFFNRTTRYSLRSKERTRFPLRRISRRRRRIVKRSLVRGRVALCIILHATILLSKDVGFLRRIFASTMILRRRLTQDNLFHLSRATSLHKSFRRALRINCVQRGTSVNSTRINNCCELRMSTYR